MGSEGGERERKGAIHSDYLPAQYPHHDVDFGNGVLKVFQKHFEELYFFVLFF